MTALRDKGERSENDDTSEKRTLPGGESFSTICLEFMDGVTVKAMENKKGRAEVCPLLLVCQDTGAIHTQLTSANSIAILNWGRIEEQGTVWEYVTKGMKQAGAS